MSLSSLINNFISTTATETKSVSALKADPNMKQLGKFVRGGLSKLGKQEISDLTFRFNEYKTNQFIIGGKQINPDPEQIKIINASPNHNIRVIAGAGTGKTTTIGCRIKYLLDNHVTPDKILVLTFNVEARNDRFNDGI